MKLATATIFFASLKTAAYAQETGPIAPIGGVYVDRPALEQPADAVQKIPLSADDMYDPLVVGGTEATPGEYPFMVMVGSNGNLSCGGSLVAPNVVLCAAHCASAAVQVYIGRHDLNDPNEAGAETFNVIERVTHPNYSSSTINNDYMMLKLSGNSQYAPVALDDGTVSPNFVGGEDLQLIGWGRTSGGGTYHDMASRPAFICVVVVIVTHCSSMNISRTLLNGF